MSLIKWVVFVAVILMGFMGFMGFMWFVGFMWYPAIANAFLAGSVCVSSLVPVLVMILHTKSSVRSREAIRRQYVQDVRACTSHAETHRVLRSVELFVKSW